MLCSLTLEVRNIQNFVLLGPNGKIPERQRVYKVKSSNEMDEREN